MVHMSVVMRIGHVWGGAFVGLRVSGVMLVLLVLAARHAGISFSGLRDGMLC